MNEKEEFLGIIRNGKFIPLNPESTSDDLRFTSIQMQEARPPESGELDLNKYEGKTIMVQGHNGGGWIYSAKIIDKAGPILTSLAEKVFGMRK